MTLLGLALAALVMLLLAGAVVPILLTRVTLVVSLLLLAGLDLLGTIDNDEGEHLSGTASQVDHCTLINLRLNQRLEVVENSFTGQRVELDVDAIAADVIARLTNVMYGIAILSSHLWTSRDFLTHLLLDE